MHDISTFLTVTNLAENIDLLYWSYKNHWLQDPGWYFKLYRFLMDTFNRKVIGHLVPNIWYDMMTIKTKVTI